MTVPSDSWYDRLRDSQALPTIASGSSMDWRMLWKDLAAGFLIAGMLSAFVPDDVWQTLFLSHLPTGWRLLTEALVGPLVAMLTFVCSIGNVRHSGAAGSASSGSSPSCMRISSCCR